MAFLAPLGLGLALSAGASLLKGSKTEAQAPRALPTRNAALLALRGEDDLTRRRGYASTILTGAQGAESSLGAGKTALGR